MRRRLPELLAATEATQQSQQYTGKQALHQQQQSLAGTQADLRKLEQLRQADAARMSELSAHLDAAEASRAGLKPAWRRYAALHTPDDGGSSQPL